MDMGYTAFGHINPFLDEGHDYVYFKTHVQKMQDVGDNVRKMRELVGDKVDLLIELHRCLTPAEAITFANMIKEHRPMFVEDPVRPETADAMARVADRIVVPIATGERFSTIYEFRVHLSRNALEYVRVDVALCGGITGAKKVATMAEAHNVQVVPHSPLSPIGLTARLQIAASIPNLAIQEYATGFEKGIFTSSLDHSRQQRCRPRSAGGKWLCRYSYAPWDRSECVGKHRGRSPTVQTVMYMRPHFDQFVVDQ